jgi:hypothetical protein
VCRERESVHRSLAEDCEGSGFDLAERTWAGCWVQTRA